MSSPKFKLYLSAGREARTLANLPICLSPPPPNLVLIPGWEFALADACDSRIIAYLFESLLSRAKAFKQAVMAQGPIAASRTRVIFVTPDTSLDVQLEADENGVELLSSHKGREALVVELETLATVAPMRVKPEETENLDADMYRMLKQISPTSDVKTLLTSTRTLHQVSKLDQEQMVRLSGKTEIHNFFHQIL